MSEIKHTPGPWEYGPGFDGQTVIYLDRGIGNHIAYISNGGVPEEAEAANTRLIAAAPDLLAAASKADQFLDHLKVSFSQGVCVHTQAMMDDLKAAIAKAVKP